MNLNTAILAAILALASNAARAQDFPPPTPEILGQFTSGGILIPVGGQTTGDSVEIRAILTHERPWPVRLEVELRPLAVAFTGQPTAVGPWVPPGSYGIVPIYGLPLGIPYHWRARTADNVVLAHSDWVAFGGNSEAAIDFETPLVEDTTAPDPILSLSVSGSDPYYPYSLKWSNTGDDRRSGQAAFLELRMSTDPIDDDNFQDCIDIAAPFPGPAASIQTMALPGQEELAPGHTWYFAMRACDEAGNRSALSSVASIFIPAEADRMAPAAVISLQVVPDGVAGYRITWPAPGDDRLRNGPATSYDLRWSAGPITNSNFAAALPIPAPLPQPPISMEAVIFSIPVFPEQLYFALKSTDDQGNVSGLSNVAFVDVDDNTPPSRVEWLVGNVYESPEGTTLLLGWRAPGDDGTTGRAAGYDARISPTPITTATWASASPLEGEPPAEIAWTWQTFSSRHPLVAYGNVFYAAVRAVDEAGNMGPLGIVIEIDLWAPDRVTDLAVTHLSGGSVNLTWTATGDDGSTGTATAYDVRFSTQPITDWESFQAATQVGQFPRPWPAGREEQMRINFLVQGTRYYFALRVSDGRNSSLVSNVATIRIPRIPVVAR